MKKTSLSLLLALAALAVSADSRRVEYGGYRVGSSDVATNETRVSVLPVLIQSSGQGSSATFTASEVNGQKIVKWWAYRSKSNVAATQTTPAHVAYNDSKDVAGSVYSMDWTYNTFAYSPAYLVVDYDWIKYNLSYNANSGTGSAPATLNNVLYTNRVTIAANPFTKTGYTFGGWTNSLTSTVWNGGESVTGSTLGLQSIVDGSNVVLRAKWTANRYTVQFNANGGSGSMADQSFTYGKAQNLSANTFTRTGYTFAGWNTKADGTGTSYSDKQSVSNLTATQNGTVTLYAKWSLVYYALTASATGTGSGTVSLNPSGGSYTNGTVVVVTAAPANGSEFTRWSDGETVNPRTYTVTDNIAVAAEFAIKTFTVTFKDYDETVLLSQVCGWGADMPYPEADPSREGYHFLGWTPTPPDTVTRTATYYANYQANPYTVKFHANTGDDEDVVKEQNFTYGTQQALVQASSLRFTKTGYTFSHWRDEGGTIYQDGEEVLNLATGGSFDLYAVWEPITYTIHFDANGGTGEMTDIADVKYDTEVTLPACAFTKSGVEFKNWKCSTETYGDGATVSNLTTTANAIVTFSAVWSEPRYIAFDGNGADDADAMAADTMTFEGVETKSLVSNKFEKTGYTFGGWATNETDAAALNATYADGADVVSTNLWRAIGETNVFYAVWSNNHYTVHFDANGGTGTMADMALTYDVETNLAIHTFTHASGLSFAGWTNYTDSVGYDDGATVSNLTAEADGEVTLFAVWDVGELSKAMHCNNLEWTSEGSAGMYAGWTKAEGDGIGYDSNSAAVSVLTKEDRTQPLKAKVTTGGTLSFKFKVVGDANITWTNANSSVTYSGLNAGTWYSETLEIAAPVEGKTKEIFLQYVLSGSAADTVRVYIDQMTWVPAGAEPTEADRPVVSGFTPATDGGFTLSVDPSNVSDSFRYQILATNELVSGEWPVKETLTADDLKAGYAITPEAGEPTMFYKVKVIAK